MKLATDHPLYDRCENWGRVMAWRMGQPVVAMHDGRKLQKRYVANAGSWEVNYRSPQREHWHYGAAPTVPPAANVQDADEIESAVRAMMAFPQTMLRAWHVWRLAEPVCIRRAAKAGSIPRSTRISFDAAMWASYEALERFLAEPRVLRRLRAFERSQAILARSGGGSDAD